MVNKLTADLPNILRYEFLSFKLWYSKEKIHIFHLWVLIIFLYIYIELFFWWRPIQSNNGHDHRALLIYSYKCELSTVHAYQEGKTSKDSQWSEIWFRGVVCVQYPSTGQIAEKWYLMGLGHAGFELKIFHFRFNVFLKQN